MPLLLDSIELRAASRLSALAGSVPAGWSERAAAAGCGVLAALAVSLIDLNLKLPGHAILKAALPLTLGFALAPRRGTGWCEAAGAGAMLLLLSRCGQPGNGVGATLSLLALGPACELALAGRWSRWQAPFRLAAAGLAANLLAFAVRGGKKAAGLDALAMRPLGEWLSAAPFSYGVCGALAGLVCGLLLFRLTGRALEPVAGESQGKL